MLKKNCLKYKASDLKQWLYITYRAILPLKPQNRNTKEELREGQNKKSF
jgi:hypothetical protein